MLSTGCAGCALRPGIWLLPFSTDDITARQALAAPGQQKESSAAGLFPTATICIWPFYYFILSFYSREPFTFSDSACDSWWQRATLFPKSIDFQFVWQGNSKCLQLEWSWAAEHYLCTVVRLGLNGSTGTEAVAIICTGAHSLIQFERPHGTSYSNVTVNKWSNNLFVRLRDSGSEAVERKRRAERAGCSRWAVRGTHAHPVSFVPHAEWSRTLGMLAVGRSNTRGFYDSPEAHILPLTSLPGWASKPHHDDVPTSAH